MDDTQVALIQYALLSCLSLPAFAYVIYRKFSVGRFLAYERRWPVPWGAVGGFLAMLLVLATFLDFLLAGDPRADKVAESLAEFSATDFVQGAITTFFLNLGFVGLIGFFIVSTTDATHDDLGIVLDTKLFFKDITTGVVAAVAALLPVYSVNALVMFGFGLTSEHPTLLRVLTDPNPLVILAALLSAGVAAPLFEEFVFRVLLQGWLERIEDESLGLVGKMKTVENEEGAEEEGQKPAPSASSVAEGALPDPENPYTSPAAENVLRMRRRQGNPPAPPVDSFGGMPHGWTPILISSFLFALVHIGFGAMPIPLFVLALVLGFLYQRTHRLTPSVAAHVTFNVISLLLTWAFAG